MIKHFNEKVKRKTKQTNKNSRKREDDRGLRGILAYSWQNTSRDSGV